MMKGYVLFALVCLTTVTGVPQVAASSKKEDLCPNGHKSCYNSKGNILQGCCEGAVCCQNMVHCCPENFACNDTLKMCVALDNEGTSPSATKNVKDVICKDGVTKCPNLTTCCLLPPGGYGCCDYPEATCCSDMTHCCPQGFDCVEGSNSCKRGTKVMFAQVTTSGQLYSRKLGMCGDGLTQCMHKVPYTNMKHIYETEGIQLDEFKGTKPIDSFGLKRRSCDVSQRVCEQGCCPDRNGTCCLKQKYCCPQNFKCTSDGMCATLKY